MKLKGNDPFPIITYEHFSGKNCPLKQLSKLILLLATIELGFLNETDYK
jgi:hypothetical protein